MLPYNETLIVLPTYNELQNIKKMLGALTNLSSNLNILVIDDNSPDGTATAVKEFQHSNPNVHLFSRAGKLGIGSAYIMGFKWGLEKGFSYIFSMDSDFSHPVESVPAMLEAATKNEIAIGSRYVDGIRISNWPLKRLLLSKFASFYVRTITGLPLDDPTAGFNCFTRRALSMINIDEVKARGYNFMVEIKYRIWLKSGKLTEVPITFYERREGASKMSGKIIFESVINVPKLRLKRIFGII